MRTITLEWRDYRKGSNRILSHNGYYLVYCPGHPFAKSKGHVYEHRYLIEREIKRFLKPSEHVHHKNRNPSDNRIENLEILPNRIHASIHSSNISEAVKIRRLQKLLLSISQRKKKRCLAKCQCGCGKEFETPDNKGRDRKFSKGHNQRGQHWIWERRRNAEK